MFYEIKGLLLCSQEPATGHSWFRWMHSISSRALYFCQYE